MFFHYPWCCARSNKRSSAVVLVVGVLLVAAVAGDVATLAYGHCCRAAPVKAKQPSSLLSLVKESGGGGGWPAGAQLVVGGGLLLSALVLLAVALQLPAQAPSLCQMWLTVHVTWGDDWARLAVGVLHDLQVKPVVDALGLTLVAAAVKDADYWWWFVQGLFMQGLVRLAASCGAQEEVEEEEDDEGMDVEAGDARPLALEAAPRQPALGPAPLGTPAIDIEEIN